MEGTAQGIKTKIICTLGPSSHEEDVLRKMTEAGMDVARLNSGHTDLDELLRYVRLVHEVGHSVGKHVGIMLDLQGPRLRVGPIQGSSVDLKSGQTFTLTTEQKRGDETRVSIPYPGLPHDLEPGDRVFMDDGLIRMVVRNIQGTDIVCDVVEGGTLLQGKGMNFPDSRLALSSFTDRDRHYLEACLDAGIDWVAQSFVRTAEDVQQVVDAIAEAGRRVPVMAKIEKPEGVRNIESILKVAQGVMVARGDLGVEMPTEEVPLIQKDLISKAMHAAIPVVTATQMLESMIEKPRPTRAEASDVANAILDGTDAVMLSAETAVGHFPVQAVEMMRRIAARAEEALDYEDLLEERSNWTHRSPADAIGFAACKIASDLKASAIITISRTGYTTKLVARYRPIAPIIAASPSHEVIDSMSVVWGVKGIHMDMTDNVPNLMNQVSSSCVSCGYVDPGDLVVITGGFLDEESSKTNMVHVHTVKAE
jgi:pyruvate kinase